MTITHLAGTEGRRLDTTVLLVFCLAEADRAVTDILAWRRSVRCTQRQAYSIPLQLTIHLLPCTQVVVRVLERDKRVLCLLAQAVTHDFALAVRRVLDERLVEDTFADLVRDVADKQAVPVWDVSN